MAARIVLQEIPILPPPIEQEPFVIGPEEAVADCCPQIFSLTPRAHIKYISNDESKENLVPAQLDKMHTKKYHWGKNDGSKAADLVESGDLVERMITPRKENEYSDWRIGEPNTPMDFSKATVDDFGISSESFTNCVGKSPRSLHKHRRRSTIGVRGSPEMNFLIRQIALQRSNRKEKAEPLTNPFMSPRNSALKVKMSSFQNAFQAVEENEGTGFSEKEERNCDAAERKVPEVKNEEIQPVPSSARGQKRKVMFADSFSPPSKKTICRIQSAESECRPSSGQALRPVLKKTPSKFSICRDEPGDQRVSFLVPETSENEDNTFFKKPVNDSVKKKKKVTFGRELSPELFDKTLPPDTPLRRGSTPYRLTVSDPATTTAEEAAHQSPSLSLPQPDFDCKDEEDTFQPISLCFDTGSPSQDTTMLLSSPGNNDPVCRMKELEDVNWEDETSETLPENPSTASPALNAEITNESFMISEPSDNRATRSSNRSKQALISNEPSTSDNPTAANSSKVTKRGRKPIKRIQVKAPRGKGKKSRRRPKKSLQKPLYGDRETASKKPLLSPIPELPECYPPTPPPAAAPSLDDSLTKRFVKKIPKRKGFLRSSRVIDVHSADDSSDPIVPKLITEGSGCLDQEISEVKSSDVGESTDPLIGLECPLMEPNADCTPELGEEAPDKGTMGATTAPKPQNKSKRRSAPRRRSSQISTTEPPSGPYNAEGNPADQNPDLLVENPSRSPELPSIPGLANRKGGRRQFCPITEPNVPTPDPCTVFPLPDEEPYLPIDEILQSAGPEKVVRRSMRLRRGSGASGLFWVPEKSSSEAPSRRKSLSSALQPLENRNPTLETQTLPMDQHAPSEATKSRRRTLCTSTLQQTSLCDPKRRRSNVSHKDSAQPITSFTLDT